jgi:hypothetical protein
MYGKEGKAEAWAKYNACDKDRAVAQQSVNLVSSELGQRDGLLSNQQDTFNKCVLALGVKNVPESPRVDVQWMTVGEQKDKNNSVVTQTVLFVARTNVTLPEVRHKLTCPFPFKFHTDGLSQKEGLTWMFENGQDSDTTASFTIQRQWRPEQTLVVVTTIPQEHIVGGKLGRCIITAKQ